MATDFTYIVSWGLSQISKYKVASFFLMAMQFNSFDGHSNFYFLLLKSVAALSTVLQFCTHIFFTHTQVCISEMSFLKMKLVESKDVFEFYQLLPDCPPRRFYLLRSVRDEQMSVCFHTFANTLLWNFFVFVSIVSEK